MHFRRTGPLALQLAVVYATTLIVALVAGGLYQTNRRIHPACLRCHAVPTGMTAAHNPGLIGCQACHFGAAEASDKIQAHSGIIRRPGGDFGFSLSGCLTCHAEAVASMLVSPMARAGGLVAVDRFAFAETASPDHGSGLILADVAAVPASPADSHVRALCSTCHLAAPKTFTGPWQPETARGGGCLACHLTYAEAMTTVTEQYHPALAADIPDSRCFGCHSRSGRVSLSYSGWAELDADSAPAGTPTRTLADGRILYAACRHRPKGLQNAGFLILPQLILWPWIQLTIPYPRCALS